MKTQFLSIPLLLLAASLSLHAQPTGSEAPSTIAAANPKSGLITIIKDGADYLSFDYYDWGPNRSGVGRNQSSTELGPHPTVHLLDHNGVKTGKTLPVQNSSFQINTARDQTPYYLIEYP